MKSTFRSYVLTAEQLKRLSVLLHIFFYPLLSFILKETSTWPNKNSKRRRKVFSPPNISSSSLFSFALHLGIQTHSGDLCPAGKAFQRAINYYSRAVSPGTYTMMGRSTNPTIRDVKKTVMIKLARKSASLGTPG